MGRGMVSFPHPRGNVMRKAILGLLAALLSTAAAAQSVQQSGTVTRGHIPYWASNGIISDAGTSADSPITSIGVTNEGGAGFCVGSQRQSAVGRNLLCFSAATAGAATISLQNYGTATAQNLNFVINGTTVTLPTGGGTFVLANGPFVAGHASCWLNTSGVLIDCGAGLVAGTQYGLAYYTATDAIGGTAAGTNGQIPVATTGGAPGFKTLSGDVATLTNAGVLTLGKVNGIPFAATYTAHGTLVAQGTGQWNAIVTNNVGYCWLSQGTSSDPIWAPCASGSGSAGGSNTQVQFNNSASLAGSANLTWVSPALTIGVAGTTTGQLALASSTATGTVTVQAPGVAGTYNFNFPTGAGSSGQPMISGGGGSTPNTFGTLGIFGGGTNCAAASGTCLDNITGFASNGYIKRTGAGTYAQTSPIPVSDGGTNLASGTSGGILGFTAVGTIASSALLGANGVIIGGGAGATPTAITAGTDGQIIVGATSAAPVFKTLSGDISAVTAAGAVTIANSSITVAKQANAAAYSLEGNFTASSAAPQFSTIGGLTQKASPAAGDLVLIQDQAASGQLKFALVSAIASAGSVSSIDARTGSFTTSNGIDSTGGNVIELTAARRTLPTTQRFSSGSGTYSTPANVLWIDIFLTGGGGGAGGNTNNGNAGGASCWNTSGAACTTPVYSTGGGGLGGVGFAGGGTGGTVTGTGTCKDSADGGMGFNGVPSNGTLGANGGHGGGSHFGTGGRGGGGIQNGNAATVLGAGGGGGGNTNGVSNLSGSGGGAGAYCYAIIGTPAATYTYAVGAAGAGSSGDSIASGGAGAAGEILVIEHYGT